MAHFLTGFFLCNIVKVAVGTDPTPDGRIIGGQDVQDATSIPWYVQLYKNGNFYCGGSIIHEKWVLTAAHCVVDGDPSSFYVVGGVIDRNDESNAQQRNVHSVHYHEDYDSYEIINDIAVLELESPFCFNENVALIDIATDADPFEDGQEYTVAGWGSTNADSYQPPSKLQVLHGYKQYGQAKCELGFYWIFGYDSFDNLTQICTGGVVGEDFCSGDSGGPVWMEVNSKPVLYGSVSYVLGGCASFYPSVVVRLSAYQEWIVSRIGMTYSELIDGLGHFIVQGRYQSRCADPTCTTRSVNDNELWNVRCCADTDPNGWQLNSWYGCSVYANSEVPECYTTDWRSAVEICDAEDGRLCTKEELENRCAAGTGCGFNSRMVWSSTADTRYYIVQGYAGAECLETTEYACNPRPVSMYEEWNVRCCADSDPGGWLQNTDCSIYTASQVPECISSDWVSAVELCSEVGGRLCTREELESGCANHSECQFDKYMVWSATEYSVECSN